MIQFPCKCGFVLEVPQDLAGGEIQCPDCHLLADVPTLTDLASINADGTFAFDSRFDQPDSVSAADLHHVFTNQTVDSHGREKDLRVRSDHFETIGLQDQQPVRVAPRYDPVTGELIRPLQFKDEEPIPVLAIATEVDPAEALQLDSAVIPMPVISLPNSAPAPSPAHGLSYANGATGRQITLALLPIELLTPGNLAVMFFVYLLYLAGYFTSIGLATYAETNLSVVRPLLLLNLPVWLVLAHLGCTIEDTGPDAFDELPRPLRDFSLADDVVNPLFRTLLAAAVCFIPFGLTWHFLDPANPMTLPINAIFAGIGIFVFPGAILTSVTGVTVLNLRPDRLAEVIRCCGVQYFLSILLFISFGLPTVFYLGNELLFPWELSSPICEILQRRTIELPVLAATVYLLHLFGWHLGMLYRAQHDNFPWIAQRHVKAEKAM